MRRSKITVFVVACVFALLLAYLFWFQVEVSQAAVHSRFGKVHRVLMGDEEGGAGLHLKLPLIDTVQLYDRRVRVQDSAAIEVQLKDEEAIVVAAYIAWRVADPEDYGKSLSGNENKAEAELRKMVNGEVAKAAAGMTFSDFVSTDENVLKFDQFEEEVRGAVQEAMDQKEYGLELVAVGVKRTAIPETPTLAVLEAMKVERETLMGRYADVSMSERRIILATAMQEAQRIVDEAEAKAERSRSQGEAEEAAVFSVFAQEPELAIFLRGLDSLRNIARTAREAGAPITWVLDTTTPPLNALLGPQRVGVEAGAAAGEPQPEGGEITDGRD